MKSRKKPYFLDPLSFFRLLVPSRFREKKANTRIIRKQFGSFRIQQAVIDDLAQ